MGIKCDFRFKGLLIPDAYMRVSHSAVYKIYPRPGENELTAPELHHRFDVEISAEKGAETITTISRGILHDAVLESFNEAYTSLKTEFIGAIDV